MADDDLYEVSSDYLTAARIVRDADEDATLHGGYAMATWSPTGDGRPHSLGASDFGRVEPSRALGAGGAGAWELGLRVDYLDLRALRGGRQRAASAVLDCTRRGDCARRSTRRGPACGTARRRRALSGRRPCGCSSPGKRPASLATNWCAMRRARTLFEFCTR